MLNRERIQKNMKIITDKISQLTDKTEINSLIEEFVNSIVGSQYSAIWLYDGNTASLRRQRDNAIAPLNTKKGLLYRCFTSKEAVLYNNLSTERRYNKLVDNYDNIDMKSVMMIPLIDNQKFIGILMSYLSAESSKIFKPDDMENIQNIVPFVLDLISLMQNPRKVERRKENKSTSFKRRYSDALNNINEVEKFRANTQTTQEILDYTTEVIHDVQVPTSGLLELLNGIRESVNDKRIKKQIDNVKTNILFTNNIASATLNSIENRRMLSKTKISSIAPSDFFVSIAESISANMAKKNINYNIFIDPLLPKEINIDTFKLKRALLNILSNAYKFTTLNGNIEFSVRYKQKDKKVHIFIKDSGIGITQDKKIDILRAFIANNITKNSYEYLGLRISNRCVQDLGGELEFYSEVDKGSTFYFDIPIEVVDEKSRFSLIKEKINLTLLIDKKNIFIANNIARYLIKMGISKSSITTVDKLEKIPKSTTHSIVFQNKIDEDFFSLPKYKNIQKLIVEESFLSLNADRVKDALLISQYEYYGDLLYSFVDKRDIAKVLIVDDDRIGASVISAMLKNEICEIQIASTSDEAIKILEDSLSIDRPYSMVFLDNNMFNISGKEILNKYRILEKKRAKIPIYAISIINQSHKKDNIFHEFNAFLKRPFNKEEVQFVFQNALKSLS